jgi:hypothetical protein
MKLPTPKYSLVSILAATVALILVLIPFHAFLTVWASTIVGHYTLLRLWKEILLAVIFTKVAYLVIREGKFSVKSLNQKLVWLIIVYALVNFIWGGVAYHNHYVTSKALGYGLIVNLRFLAFFLVTWFISLKTSWLKDNWQKLVLWPAAAVIAFGLLQLVLPINLLSHFGYSLNTTISPYETVNHNLNYIRIMSTLRGANPLGAYLLIPISVLVAMTIRNKRRWQEITLGIAALMALYFSYSRSAMLGTALSIVIILALSLKSSLAKRNALIAVVGLVLIFGVIGMELRNNIQVQNVIFHTQTQSAIKTTSDQGHATALQSGINDLARRPLGTGVGTAGPASVYNNHLARISENYYIQIGQEMGWLGLVLFAAINLIVGYILFKNRKDILSLALFASFIGLVVVNSLSHAWADDTLAYLWWGLAGIAIAQTRLKSVANELNPKP